MLDTLKRLVSGQGEYQAKVSVEYDDVPDKFDSAKEDREPMERVWQENLAFYMGRQWLQWNETTKTLYTPKLPEWKVMFTANMIQPRVITEYAKLIQQKPTAQVRPQSSEPEDIRKAKTNNKILDAMWKPTGSEDAKNQSQLWALICGTGIMKIYWDPDKGPVISDFERGIFQPLGEICVDALSPFELYVPPLARNIREVDWFFHTKLRTKEYVEDKWPGSNISEEEYVDEDHLEGRIARITDVGVSSRKKGILVKEFWQIPSRKFPTGRYVVHGNDTLLEASENPYRRAHRPLVAWQHRPVPGRFWGDSLPNQLADPQRNYNKSRSQSIEGRNLLTKGKWLIPIGSLPSGREPTDAPGEIIEYVPIAGQKPEMLVGKDVPATVWRDLEQSLKEFNEISGQHEVTQAQAPGQVKAGVAIQALQEQDDLRLTPAAMTFENAIADGEGIKLKLGRQFYQEQRTARIVGEGDRIEVVEFSKEDILDEADIEVEAGSSLPKSLAGKREFITSLVQLGVLKDPRLIARLMQFDELDELFEEVNRDISSAERENDKMSGKLPGPPDPITGTDQPGMPIEVNANDWDNDEMHLYTHEKFMKSEEFENMDPNIQQFFIQHRLMHKQQIMQKQMALQAAAGAGGTPGGGGGGATGGGQQGTADVAQAASAASKGQ